ncbi:phospholipase B1, membrane-associated-like [Neocloeon triangulifer]|uniref:phospholipase B1, membrane-associated-like n=1 Tax=Neocloeon triangulifer TaxID=2078957 RepID=UPI00286F5BC0|nr:phospholipase B1, membrane-associated-like [Neocloeon triangulifer]XP_059480397.1 phospholipase B1, membrane-associated-like [Neocloeon triangulifer]
MVCWTHVLVTLALLSSATLAGFSRRQTKVPKSLPFPCHHAEQFRSLQRPNSVHKLMPGDIDVVAAMGDSLTAATGAVAEDIYSVISIENRGMSFSIGGQGTWREFLTVPNILKNFNSNLTGFSVGDGHSESRSSRFNVAVNGAMDQDMEFAAATLVRRMQADHTIDFKNDWKMINVWVGTNDICSDFCYDGSQGPNGHFLNLQKTLDYLHQHVPRAFVNLISAPYIPAYAQMRGDEPTMCLTMLPFMCSCLFGINHPAKMKNVTKATRYFQMVEQALVESGRYDTRDDFTVQYQPTFKKLKFPKYRDRRTGVEHTDYSYLALDCFHYSQKFHAVGEIER